MKIIHIIESLRAGGKERQLIETLKFFKSQNIIQCELIVMSDICDYNYIHNIGIETHYIIRKFKKDPAIFFKLYKIFKSKRPNIIHSWGSMCSVYALPAAKFLGIKFVNNFLQDASPIFRIKNKEWFRTKLTFPFSDKIAANSYAGLKAYHVPSNKSVCLHNGFDFSRINGIDKKENVKVKFNISTEYVVGMVASFTDNKDYFTFIECANYLLRKRNDITFIAIGDGKNFNKIRKVINPKVQDKIMMIGKQKRVLNIVNLFDIGILTTNTIVHCEGIPNAVMEFMALKIPVIVTDCGGNSELVENYRTGFLVKAFDPDILCNKIEQLIQNKKLANEYGRNGFEKLKNEFTLEKMGKKFLDLYANLYG